MTSEPKKLTKSERETIYDKCFGRCAYCGIKLEYKDMQVDHVKPLRLDGEDEIQNMLPSCRSCNHYKRGNTLEAFRKMIENIPDKLFRDSYIYRVGLRYRNVKPEKHKVKFYFEALQEVRDERAKRYGVGNS